MASSGAGTRAGSRRTELSEFLRSRRARMTPAEAGLPEGGGRRRTPGLRREEVAVLAGVGASWYQWLEQGRDITVSPHVLDAVSRVLKLSGAERRHLYVLAGLNPPLPTPDPAYTQPCEGLNRLIDTWMPFPAHIMDAYWNCVVFNEAAALALAMTKETTQNCLVAFFTDPRYRARAASWECNAPQVVAQYRAACSANPDDEGFEEIVSALLERSPEFAELWERRDIAPGGLMAKELVHPEAGELFFESTQLQVPARPDLTVVLHTPAPGTDTAERMQWLTSPMGRRQTMRPIAG